MELANRCSTKADELDLRQSRTHELIDILVQAWRLGPKTVTGSLWGAMDQELAIRQRNYLGLGENRLAEMLSSLESEGAYDRKDRCYSSLGASSRALRWTFCASTKPC